eukprot:COSAG04_NODE_2198_length_4550_cov_171.247360_9_plen_49_part_00
MASDVWLMGAQAQSGDGAACPPEPECLCVAADPRSAGFGATHTPRLTR